MIGKQQHESSTTSACHYHVAHEGRANGPMAAPRRRKAVRTPPFAGR